MGMLDIKPSDDAHKVLMKETENRTRDINTLLSEKREVLTNLPLKESDGTTLALCSWEVIELANIGRHAKVKFAETCEFHFKDIDRTDYDDLKLSAEH